MMKNLKELSELFADINNISPSLVKGRVSIDKDKDVNVHLLWNKKDLVNNTTNHYEISYSMLKNECTQVKQAPFPTKYDYDLISISPSKKYFLTLKLESLKNDTSSPPIGIFSIYTKSTLYKTFRTTSALHGTIYTGEREGGIVWSHDETKFAYIAEKKQEETSAYWKNVNEEVKSTKNEPVLGKKYVYEDDWGELYVGKKTGSIFLATIDTGKIQNVQGIPSNITCSDLNFSPDDKVLVFTGIETNAPRRLGIVYCFNRPLALYTVDLESSDGDENITAKMLFPKEIETIHWPFATSRSGRFSPDGSKLAFLATNDIVTHNTCSKLCILEWNKRQEMENAVTVIIDITDLPSMPNAYSLANAPIAFNGIYSTSLLRNCWSSDSNYIYINTQMGARILWKIVDIRAKSVLSPPYIDEKHLACETLLDQAENLCLVEVSAPNRPSNVYLVNVDPSSKVREYSRPPIELEAQNENKCGSYIKEWQVFSIPTKDADEAGKAKRDNSSPLLSNLMIPPVFSTSDYEGFLLVPSSAPPDTGYPVILDLHGGPNGCSPLMFRLQYTYLCACGFAIVSINYRGSIGFGQVALDSLIGKAGTQDVFDSHYGLLHILKNTNVPLDSSRIHCSGGSHGGFLVAHLISQFPGFYKSVVARNPVINLVTLLGTSDIPEWSLGVVGLKRVESLSGYQDTYNGSKLPPLTVEEKVAIQEKLWRHSPLSNDWSKVTTPLLLGIGGVDLRVPSKQGLELKDTLASHDKVPVQTLWYPKDSHPLASVEAYGDFSVMWAFWILQHNN